MQRRRFLHSTVIGATGAALGGCLGLGGDDSSNSIQIADVELINSDSQTHTADIRIQRDQNTVHEDSYELESGGSTTIDNLSEDAGEYSIRVELQDSDADVFDESQSELTEADCISVDIEILGGDTPTITQDATECSEKDTNESG